MNIGDLFLRVVAELSDFDSDLQKKATESGDKAGATLGQRMGGAVRSNFGKVIAAGGALVGGVVLKGLQELNTWAADFRAQTGASADEADRAKKSLLQLSATNIQPLGEIGDAMTKVRTEMGLTGPEADAVTQKFLTFARVTKNDAAAEVESFDGILDAWGLTADKAGGIMDALVLSHQRFGGVISDDERALQALAPALLATNQTWQDGITLINLFKASGVDVDSMITGLNHALAKIKSPAELRLLINDLISTEDPTLRATKAIDLFGAKAGPKLAIALKPGAEALDAWSTSGADSVGVTQKAADAMNANFGTQFQLLLKSAGSAIIGFGNDWGGLATVIATSLTIAGGLGGGKLIDKMQDALGGGWTKAASSGPFKRAVAYAAGKGATLYLGGLILGDKISDALAGAWSKTGARLLAAAGISGTQAGTAFAAASAAAIVAAPIAVIYVALQIADDVRQAKATLSSQIDRVIQEGTLEGLQHAKQVLQDQIGSQKILGIIPFQFAGEVDAMNAQIARIDAAIASLPPPMKTATDAATTMDTKTSNAWHNIMQVASHLEAKIRTSSEFIKSQTDALVAKLVGDAQAIINGYYDPIIAQDELRVAKDTVATDTVARNATKAGSAQRHEADLTLANAQKNLEQTRLNLLASGQLTAKEQKEWLSELQKKYKTATGDARAKIAALIAKIEELARTESGGVRITVDSGANRGKAQGGPVTAGVPYLVNENTPNSEVWVPSVSGMVYPSSSAVPLDKRAQGGDTTINVAVAGLMRARTPGELTSSLRRLGDFGVLPDRSLAEEAS